MNIRSKRCNRKYLLSSGRLAESITAMRNLHAGFFKTYRQVRQERIGLIGELPFRVGLISLRLLYRTPKFYKGTFTTELARIKCRFIKEES